MSLHFPSAETMIKYSQLSTEGDSISIKYLYQMTHKSTERCVVHQSLFHIQTLFLFMIHCVEWNRIIGCADTLIVLERGIVRHISHHIRGENHRLGVSPKVSGTVSKNKAKFTDNSTSLLQVNDEIENTIQQPGDHIDDRIICQQIVMQKEREYLWKNDIKYKIDPKNDGVDIRDPCDFFSESNGVIQHRNTTQNIKHNKQRENVKVTAPPRCANPIYVPLFRGPPRHIITRQISRNFFRNECGETENE